jgi:hypothetical protein
VIIDLRFQTLEIGNAVQVDFERCDQIANLISWSSIDLLHKVCDGRIASGYPNLVDELRKFRAYNDPVRKKSYFFLALMRNSGIWSYVDDQNLGAPVDYHEVRGHLRLATVQIADQRLRDKVLFGREVTLTEDIAIRGAVHNAITYISEKSGLCNPSRTHYLFWNLFRSICTRVSPQCLAISPNTALPRRYFDFLEGIKRCPFADMCPSAAKPNPILEHVCSTDYY